MPGTLNSLIFYSRVNILSMSPYPEYWEGSLAECGPGGSFSCWSGSSSHTLIKYFLSSLLSWRAAPTQSWCRLAWCRTWCPRGWWSSQPACPPHWWSPLAWDMTNQKGVTIIWPIRRQDWGSPGGDVLAGGGGSCHGWCWHSDQESENGERLWHLSDSFPTLSSNLLDAFLINVFKIC